MDYDRALAGLCRAAAREATRMTRNQAAASGILLVKKLHVAMGKLTRAVESFDARLRQLEGRLKDVQEQLIGDIEGRLRGKA